MSVCCHCRRLLRLSGPISASIRVHLFRSTELSQQWRGVSFLPNMADRVYTVAQKRKDYREEKILGYTQEQVYSVVSDVNNYKSFLPWCQDSQYLTREPKCTARLAIGFPPLIETYTASVVTEEPHSLRTMSTDGRLFTRLENAWYFRRGPDLDSGPTCLVNFWVSFEFRSLFYAQLGYLVFDEVARTMAGAFEAQCGQVFGPDHLKVKGVRTVAGIKKLLEKSKSNELRKHGKLMETD